MHECDPPVGSDTRAEQYRTKEQQFADAMEQKEAERIRKAKLPIVEKLEMVERLRDAVVLLKNAKKIDDKSIS